MNNMSFENLMETQFSEPRSKSGSLSSSPTRAKRMEYWLYKLSNLEDESFHVRWYCLESGKEKGTETEEEILSPADIDSLLIKQPRPFDLMKNSNINDVDNRVETLLTEYRYSNSGIPNGFTVQLEEKEDSAEELDGELKFHSTEILGKSQGTC